MVSFRFFFFLVVAVSVFMGILVPQPGINPMSLQRKHRVLKIESRHI